MKAMRDAWGEKLVELGKNDPRTVVLDGDLANSTKADKFASAHPDLKAVATASAALFVSWPDARGRKVFADEANWRAEEPLLHTGELRPDTLGVWCGEADPFLAADRKLVKAVSPAVARFSPGGHKDEYWRGILPDVLAFVGHRLA